MRCSTVSSRERHLPRLFACGALLNCVGLLLGEYAFAADESPTGLPAAAEIATIVDITDSEVFATQSANSDELSAAQDDVVQAVALQQPAPPAVGGLGPTVLPPVDVVVEEPERPNLTSQMPTPLNAFADTIYDSPFFAAPVEGYAAGSSTTAAKINMGIIEFPGIVNTVTQDLIRDRQSITFEQAMRTVPNVSPRSGAGFRSDEFYIRGFNVGFGGNDFRKDGFRDSSWVQREVQNIERIEVLKGPASAIYGNASQPAGLINVITKKPLNENFADINQQFGSFDLYRTTGDINSQMFGSQNALMRVNFAVQESDSFRDFVFVDRQFIAPAFTFVVDSQTQLTFQGEYLHDSRITDRGTVFFPFNPTGNPLSASIYSFYGQPTDRNNYEDGQFNLFLTREVFDGLNLRLGYVGNWSGEQRNNYDTRNVVGQNVTRQFVQQRSIAQDQYFIGDATWELGDDWINHRLLLGTELGTTITDTQSRNSVVTGFPVNIFNPYTTPGANYGLYPSTPTLAAPLTSGSQQDNYAVYFQDMIQITPYFKTLLGVRGNWIDQKGFSNATSTDQSFTAVTPRYGIVLEPIPEDLSFYVSYSETFNPLNGFRAGPTPGSTLPLDPESGWGFDVGTKMRLRDELFLTIGYFDIERTNVAQAVPNSVPPVSQQFGLVRSTGMEVELTGRITERWSIINGYGMADARIEQDRVAANVGKHLTNSPYWQGSLWTRYNFIQNRDHVAGIGFGMYYSDFWHISADNLYTLPAYQRYDIAFFHDIGRWKTALFIENIADARYASGANGNTTVVPGAPISARGTIGVSF